MELGAARVAQARIVELVDAYSRRIYPAALLQHPKDSVSSPLGAWLLLAACVSGARGAERAGLEDAVGCSASEASELLEVFFSAPPLAVSSALAVWFRTAGTSRELVAWVDALPAAVESGVMPTQKQADEWADRHTLGLIKEFPFELDSPRVALVSALGARVSWSHPFELRDASEELRPSSPWVEKLRRVLWDGSGVTGSLVETSAAGLVAVHLAIAQEDLTVISVAADQRVERGAVLEAAHEIAARMATGSEIPSCSLFDLPLGEGHSWTITESETPAWEAGERSERIAGVSLPAWRLDGHLELLRSDLFAMGSATQALRQLIGPRPDDQVEAKQVVAASFTQHGFEAGATTAALLRTSLARSPTEIGIERLAVLRFDHPYAALAISGRPYGSMCANSFAGLPLFSAWIHTPTEADAES